MSLPRVCAAVVALFALSAMAAEGRFDKEIRDFNDQLKKRIEQSKDPVKKRWQTLQEEANKRLTRCKNLEKAQDNEEDDDEDKTCLELDALQSVLNPPAAKPGDLLPVQAVLKGAKDAQDTVDKWRAKAKDAYDQGDRATASALALPSNASMGFEGTVENAKRWVRHAQTQPRELKNAVSAAQKAADKLVEVVLARRKCKDADEECLTRNLVRGEVAKKIFDLQIARAEAAHLRLNDAELGLAVVKDNPRIDETALQKDFAFRKLLNDNPDVKSFFGGDAVGVSAGSDSADSTLSFRVVKDLDGSVLGRRSRLSLIFTAPTNKGSVTRFVDSADALKNLRAIKLGWQLTNAPFSLPGVGLLNDFAVGVGAGQDPHTYFLVDPADPNKAIEQKHKYSAVSLSIRWAFLINPTSEDYKTLLLLGLDRQRSYEDGDTETRCPSSSAPGLVPCYQGAWGEPAKTFSSVLGMEVRQHMPAIDIGLKLKHNRKTHVLDVEVPIYLARLFNNDKEKSPFSAGITLSRSTGEKGLSWGLFVSTPLQFSKPDR
jgi:hypothetical protein